MWGGIKAAQWVAETIDRFGDVAKKVEEKAGPVAEGPEEEKLGA